MLALLIVLAILLLSIILAIIVEPIQKKAEKNESTFDVTPVEEDIDQGKILREAEIEYEIVEPRSLDQQYADAWRLTICPYCETFNSQTSEKCCACGQAIHK